MRGYLFQLLERAGMSSIVHPLTGGPFADSLSRWSGSLTTLKQERARRGNAVDDLLSGEFLGLGLRS